MSTFADSESLLRTSAGFESLRRDEPGQLALALVAPARPSSDELAHPGLMIGSVFVPHWACQIGANAELEPKSLRDRRRLEGASR